YGYEALRPVFAATREARTALEDHGNGRSPRSPAPQSGSSRQPRVRRQRPRGHGPGGWFRVPGPAFPVPVEDRARDYGDAVERVHVLRVRRRKADPTGGRSMSDIPFHQTRMGHAFYEATMPGLVRELARLNANLEQLLVVAEVEGEKVATTAPADSGSESGR